MRGERRRHHPDTPGLTAGMATLDKAAIKFCARSEGVAAAHRAFTAARYAFQTARGGYAAHWSRAAEAAGMLAAALRELGDLRIGRCACGAPLEDGACPEHWTETTGGGARVVECAVCGLACTCGTCGGTGRVRL